MKMNDCRGSQSDESDKSFRRLVFSSPSNTKTDPPGNLTTQMKITCVPETRQSLWKLRFLTIDRNFKEITNLSSTNCDSIFSARHWNIKESLHFLVVFRGFLVGEKPGFPFNTKILSYFSAMFTDWVTCAFPINRRIKPWTLNTTPVKVPRRRRSFHVIVRKLEFLDWMTAHEVD